MISKSFLNFFSGKRPSTTNRKTVARKSLKLEALEDRHMLSVSVEFDAPIVNDFAADTGNVTVNPELLKHQAIFSADFNNDGKIDLFLIDQNSSKAYTYLNNGQASNAFSVADPPFSPSEGLRLMTQAAVGKVNGDNNVDLLTSYAEDDVLYFSLYRGNGNGGFYTAPTNSQFDGLREILNTQLSGGILSGSTVSAFVRDLSLVDTNGDGKLDIVCNVAYDIVRPDQTGESGAISLVFPGDGSGEFKTAPTVISSASTGIVLAVGNLNGDSTIDKVTKDGQTLKINTGTSTITTPQYSYTIGNVWVAQTKANGTNEIITSHSDGTNHYISVTGVTTSAAIRGYYQLDIVPFNVTTGDFNNDGFTDILVSDGEIYQTLVGKSDGTFAKEGAVINHADFTTSCVTDVNGNGVQDVLAVGQRFVWMVSGESTGTSSPGSQIVIDFSIRGITPQDVAFGDFNNDGKMDVAVLTHTGTEVYVFYNTSTAGNVSFGNVKVLDVTRGKRLLVANFDNALGDDISVYGIDPSNLSKPTLQTYLATASGFDSSVRSSTLDRAYDHLAVGDLNNDGIVDIIAISNATASSSPAYHTLLNNADNLGRFTKKDSVNFGTTSTKPTAVAIGDLNKDGRNDLAILDASGKQVFIFTQSTTNAGIFPTSSTPVSVTNASVDEASFKTLILADFSADGVLDILVGVVGKDSSAQFRILENTTSKPGTFTSATNFTTVGEFRGDANSSSLAFHVGLIDNNSTADVVIVGGNTVKRFANTNKTGAEIGTVTLVFRDYNSQIINTEVVDLNTLSNRLSFIDEWSNFWVEIWANTGSVAGISEFSAALTFNSGVFEVRPDHVVKGAAFGNNFSYSISEGKITLSGKLSASDLQGDNTNTLLARVSFMPAAGEELANSTTGAVGLPLDVYNNTNYLSAYNHGFSLDTSVTKLTTSTGMAGVPTVDASEDKVPLFPVMFDLNDDGLISWGDFALFVTGFEKNVTDTSAAVPKFVRLFDFDHNGYVGFYDFAPLVTNMMEGFSRQHFRNNPGAKLAYPSDFNPADFIQSPLSTHSLLLNEVAEELTMALPPSTVIEPPQQQGANALATQALLEYVTSQEKKSDDYGIGDLNTMSETERLLAEGKL